MGIKREELLTNDLEICENCEWCIPTTNEKGETYPSCLLTANFVGLLHKCDKFKKSTGNHISV